MLEIRINEERTIVENTDKRCTWTIGTVEFFGNVYSTLEKHFPEIAPEVIEKRTKQYLLDKLNGKPIEPQPTIFGCTEMGDTLLSLIGYIEENIRHDIGTDRSYIFPTLRELEEYRISNRMKSNYLPDSFDDNKGICFSGLTTVTQVLIAALYYYAYHDYKLARCQHCGTWFATKTLKKKYCDRISPCFGVVVKGKTPLSCEQTVRNILQKCGRIRNRIETKANQTIAAQLHESVFQVKFRTECDHLYMMAKNDPTVENLTNYYNYLQATEKERGWINNG